jgi:hypothetical protein
LPPYHSIKIYRESPHLEYNRANENASDGQRHLQRRNLRMKMRSGADVADEVARLRTKFEQKYPGVVM